MRGCAVRTCRCRPPRAKSSHAIRTRPRYRASWRAAGCVCAARVHAQVSGQPHRATFRRRRRAASRRRMHRHARHARDGAMGRGANGDARARRFARKPRGRRAARALGVDARPEGRGHDLPGYRRSRVRLRRRTDRALSCDLGAAASRMVLTADDAGVAGLLVQRLPGGSEIDDATWKRVEGVVDAVRGDDLSQARPPATRSPPLFPRGRHAGVQGAAGSFAARARGSAWRRRFASRGCGSRVDPRRARHVEATCEFCNRRYAFTPDEARAVFAGDTRQVA